MMSDELKPCRECGAPCQVEVFDCVHGQATLWLCSQHTWLGGRCPSNTAYLTEDAWNQRTTPTTDSTELETRLRRDAICMRAWAEGRGPFPDTVKGVSSKHAERAEAAADTLASQREKNVRLKADLVKALEGLRDALPSLCAAVSLLKRGGKAAKKAAASDRMFDQMVVDYEKSIERARQALKDTTHD